MTYHPFADLLDTYQSLTPLLQALWLIVPPLYAVVMFRVWLVYRLELRKAPPPVIPAPSRDPIHAETAARFYDEGLDCPTCDYPLCPRLSTMDPGALPRPG